MEKETKKKLLIAAAVAAAVVLAIVLYFRYMPAWASLQVLAAGLAGLVVGFLLRWLYDRYLSGLWPLLWNLIKGLFSRKGGADAD